jgi:alkylated DNA nucleotide flippase Atl1
MPGVVAARDQDRVDLERRARCKPSPPRSRREPRSSHCPSGGLTVRCPAIARTDSWGRTQIHARGRALAERIFHIWPGPDEPVGTAPPVPSWKLMTQVLASIPAGRWTSYSDVAEVIGSHQVAVGNRLATTYVPNAHRVLRPHGTISPELSVARPRTQRRPTHSAGS